MRFPRIQEAGLRLRTDNSGNPLSPSGSSMAAANLCLAGLRSVSKFPGAEGFPRLLATRARRPAVCGHRRALQTDQACRTTRRGRSLPAALTRGGAELWGDLCRSCAKCFREIYSLHEGQFSEITSPHFLFAGANDVID